MRNDWWRHYIVVCGKDELYCDNRDEALYTAIMLMKDDVDIKYPVYVICESLVWFDGKTVKNGKVVEEGDINV